jgi:type VI secretion system secreted protein VgrG
VKVQFHWDRYGKADENASCWVRVAQAWAGKKWGFITLPRIGQEVIVEFEEGDPDRPIVTGRVYNGDSKPPYDLPGSATMSTWKSMSSKGGGGFNEIRFEDKKDEEQVFIHAQKNFDLRVKNDRFETIEHNDHLIVKTDKHEHVENNRSEVVDKDHKEKVGGDRHLAVCGKQAVQVGGSHSFVVKGDVIDVFKANHSEQVTGDRYLKASNIVVEAQTISFASGGNYITIDSSGISIIGSKVTIQGGTVLINTAPGSPAGMFTPTEPVPPAAPVQAEEADKADPGEMAQIKKEQLEHKEGKYGKSPVKPFKAQQQGGAADNGADGDNAQPKKLSWIEIELVDEADKPVPGEPYCITLPDGQTVAEGTLDEKGFARVDGIEPGMCRVTFPQLDEPLWERIG